MNARLEQKASIGTLTLIWLEYDSADELSREALVAVIVWIYFCSGIDAHQCFKSRFSRK